MRISFMGHTRRKLKTLTNWIGTNFGTPDGSVNEGSAGSHAISSEDFQMLGLSRLGFLDPGGFQKVIDPNLS